MTKEEFKKLDVGDIVHHASGSQPLIVTANYGKRVTAVMTADMTNPQEWVLVLKATHK